MTLELVAKVKTEDSGQSETPRPTPKRSFSIVVLIETRAREGFLGQLGKLFRVRSHRPEKGVHVPRWAAAPRRNRSGPHRFLKQTLSVALRFNPLGARAWACKRASTSGLSSTGIMTLTEVKGTRSRTAVPHSRIPLDLSGIANAPLPQMSSFYEERTELSSWYLRID